jgi:hypothetical protein
VRALPTPAWWNLRLPRSRPRPEDPIPSVTTTTAPVQPALFAAGRPPPTASLPSASTAPLVHALRRSSVFQAHVEGQPEADVERVLACVAALAEAGGALPITDFAAAAGVRPHQVGGAVARMGILNADGFAMVEHDHVGRRVVLHRARLSQHYGIKE